MTRHRLPAARLAETLVRLAFHGDTCHIDRERTREVSPHLVDVRSQLRPLGNHRDIDIADREPGVTDLGRGGAQVGVRRCRFARAFAR